ncbi:MAG TPA: hypothetical protein PLZ36_02715, partial [Armatimonadota bacterium]|nr:hypothetical protein [Armatimonadota bacterium]
MRRNTGPLLNAALLLAMGVMLMGSPFASTNFRSVSTAELKPSIASASVIRLLLSAWKKSPVLA